MPGQDQTPSSVRNLDLDGLAALVTGGGSGIGLATARLLAARGAAVAVLDVKPGEEFPAVTADVTDDAAVRSAVATAAERLGGLDVLVNNAGIGAAGTVADNSDEEWHHVYDVNVVGMVRVSRAALPHLRRSAHPVIVNTCSIAAIAGLPQRALYSATKGAVLSLTLAMAADFVAEGIRVNCVCPGPLTPRGWAGCWTRPPTRWRSARRWKRGSRWGGSSPPRRWRPGSRTWPARSPRR